ncbi:hypothetical protein BpHYR1_049881 [Brachionus plicatilis]|uniref:Uncharacterized protein n=1 Tax=Brachionus plicatilis TaxID=10195 RepID=A0A3M7TC92_BRAPC|nr:hypothetical protein BpHYR1_049881 [Brachionus plicatilis]
MHKTCEYQANCDNEKVKAMIKEYCICVYDQCIECKHKIKVSKNRTAFDCKKTFSFNHTLMHFDNLSSNLKYDFLKRNYAFLRIIIITQNKIPDDYIEFTPVEQQVHMLQTRMIIHIELKPIEKELAKFFGLLIYVLKIAASIFSKAISFQTTLFYSTSFSRYLKFLEQNRFTSCFIFFRKNFCKFSVLIDD